MKKFVPYILYGYPSMEKSYETALNFRKAADIYEIGFPFSDPIADGKVIHSAATYTLKNNDVSFNGYIKFINKLKKDTGKPVYAMTYYNPALKYGLKKFVDSGIDGFIIPDLSIEESNEICGYAEQKQVKTVFIVTPDSTEQRIKLIGGKTTGFIYYVSFSGVTGTNTDFKKEAMNRVNLIKRLTGKNVYVGFGIKTSEHLKKVLKYADGGIIGSAIIENKIVPEDILKIKLNT
jgi:tryptophan synthase alpha chain